MLANDGFESLRGALWLGLAASRCLGGNREAKSICGNRNDVAGISVDLVGIGIDVCRSGINFARSRIVFPNWY